MRFFRTTGVSITWPFMVYMLAISGLRVQDKRPFDIKGHCTRCGGTKYHSYRKEYNQNNARAGKYVKCFHCFVGPRDEERVSSGLKHVI